MKLIENEHIPRPAGHYSPVVEHNGVLYVSGQLPRAADGTIPEGITAQTEAVLAKLDNLLVHANSGRHRVLQVRIYVPDVKYWDEVNRIYSAFFGTHRPARCVVPSRDLHHGCLIELEAVAATLDS